MLRINSCADAIRNSKRVQRVAGAQDLDGSCDSSKGRGETWRDVYGGCAHTRTHAHIHAHTYTHIYTCPFFCV